MDSNITAADLKVLNPRAANAAYRLLADMSWESLVEQYHFLCKNAGVQPEPLKKFPKFGTLKKVVHSMTKFWSDDGRFYMDVSEPGHNMALVWNHDAREWE